MRLPILAAIAATALSASTTAHAELWWVIGASADSGALLAELDSKATNTAGHHQMWIAMFFAPSITQSSKVRIVRSLWEFDCTEGRYNRDIQITATDRELSPIISYNSPSGWRYAAPGTTENAILDVSCDRSDKDTLAGPFKNLVEAANWYFNTSITQNTHQD